MKLYQIVTLTSLIAFSCGSGEYKNDASESEVQSTQEQNSGIHKRVSLEEFNEIIKDEEVQLIDIRTPGEYAGGYIEDAVNIDFMAEGFIENCNSSLDKNKPMAIYCAGGGRSAKALTQLKEAGFKQVYELGVGYSGYNK